MWVRAPLFPLFSWHFRELAYRSFYFFISWSLSFALWFFYLPSLFAFSPFFFLHFKWDDAFFSLLILASILAAFSALPVGLWQAYSWSLPALLPREASLLSFSFFWIFAAFSLFSCSAPFLFFLLPPFFLSFHSDAFFFSPNISLLADLAIDFSFSFFFLLGLPVLFFFHFSRAFLYFIASFFAALFGDFFSFLLVLFPSFLSIELSLFFFIWSRLWLSQARLL